VTLNLNFESVIFFLAAGLSLLASLYMARRHNDESSREYFMAGFRLSPWLSGLSLPAAYISAWHIMEYIGLDKGRGNAFYADLLILPALLILGVFFIPAYMNDSLRSISEFIRRRFNAGIALWYAAGLMLFNLLRILLLLFAAGTLLQKMLGWNPYLGAYVMLIAAGLFAIIGGLRAIVFSGAVHTVFMLLLLAGFVLTGTKHAFPMEGGFFSLPFFALVFVVAWLWLGDQNQLQRLFATGSIAAARKALWAAALSFTLIAILLTASTPALSRPFIASEAGAAGFVAYLALALMLLSALASLLFSSATLFSYDILPRVIEAPVGRKRVLAARLFSIVSVPLVIVLVPTTLSFAFNLFDTVAVITIFIVPALLALILFALVSGRTPGRLSWLLFAVTVPAAVLMVWAFTSQASNVFLTVFSAAFLALAFVVLWLAGHKSGHLFEQPFLRSAMPFGRGKHKKNLSHNSPNSNKIRRSL